MRTTSRLSAVSLAIFFWLFAAPVSAANVTLAWDANIEEDVIGYRVLWGTSSGHYTSWVDAGPATMVTIRDLEAGLTYYFAVQAYNDVGLESGPSSEVSFTVAVVYRTGRLAYDPATGTWSEPLLDRLGNTPAAVPGWDVYPADFDGDGWTDLLMYNPSTGAWMKALDNREGSYAFHGGQWAAGWTPYIADLDGDRRDDVFLYNGTTGAWFKCLSRGRQTADFNYAGGGSWVAGWQIHPADFDGDGRDDLFLYNGNSAPDPNSGMWYRVMSTPSGNFDYFGGDRWVPGWQIHTADFDADGRSDLFLYRPDGMWYRVTFWGAQTVYAAEGRWASGWSITPGDFNGDGRADLFLYNPNTGVWYTVVTLPNMDVRYVEGLWTADWKISAGSFNGDALSDLRLYNDTTGQWFEVHTRGPGSFAYATGFVDPGRTLVR